MNSNLRVTQFFQHIFKPAYQKLLSSCLLLLSPPSSQPEGCGLWITKIQEKIEETKCFFLVWLIQRNLDEGHLWTSSPPFFETTGQGAGWGAWINLTGLTLLFLVIIHFTSFFCFWPNNKNCQWYNKSEGLVWALYLISSQQGFKPTAFYTQVGKNSASKSRPNFGFNILTKLQPKVFTKIQLQKLNHTSSIIGACQQWPIGTRIE